MCFIRTAPHKVHFLSPWHPCYPHSLAASTLVDFSAGRQKSQPSLVSLAIPRAEKGPDHLSWLLFGREAIGLVTLKSPSGYTKSWMSFFFFFFLLIKVWKGIWKVRKHPLQNIARSSQPNTSKCFKEILLSLSSFCSWKSRSMKRKCRPQHHHLNYDFLTLSTSFERDKSILDPDLFNR